jgi:hypothetical protein
MIAELTHTAKRIGAMENDSLRRRGDGPFDGRDESPCAEISRGACMKKEQQPIPVEVDEKAAEGIYSNFVLTAHTASEFIVDFARILPGLKKAKVFSRIVMTPQTAKSLHMVLTRTIEKYEKTFGEIQLKGGKQVVPPIGFQMNLPGDEEKKH